MNMKQKRFTFDDENEQEVHSKIDIFNDYQQEDSRRETSLKQDSQISTLKNKPSSLPQHNKKETLDKQKTIKTKKPKTKVKKKTKRKTKNKVKTKVIKEKQKRSWFSTLFLFLLSLLIIAGVCFGGYVAYQYYLKQQNQIEELQQQLDQSKTTPQEKPIEDAPSQEQTPPPSQTPEDNENQNPDQIPPENQQDSNEE